MERGAVASTDYATRDNIEVLTENKCSLVIGLVFIRAIDASLTYYGLSIGLREANPIVVVIIETFGIIPGLFFLSSVSLVLLFFLGEYLLPGVAQSRHTIDLWSNVAYLSVLIVWSAVSLHNVILIWI
ncbi:DUF5658 family protein [Natronomonas gomsonensis]|uniref:DUF5658 family protein n=1 Tax=Natronomonas gomsonensis TaxID=1046043 RepID=UPI00398C440D